MKREFCPQLSPQEMLELGVFGGWYFKSVIDEFCRLLTKDGIFTSLIRRFLTSNEKVKKNSFNWLISLLSG